MIDAVGRLVYIEPNLYAAEQGIKFGDQKSSIWDNRTWNPEDFNISVDLQVVVPNRGECGQKTTFPVKINSFGHYTSFLGGSYIDKNSDQGNYLTTEYTEASYSEIRAGNVSTTESLGISSIDIRFDAHFFPQVTMKLTDVRGYSLFMPAEEEYVEGLKHKRHQKDSSVEDGRPYTNLFKAVFHFPYPQFLLTIKGFYGNKVTFILAVNDFKTALNGQNGNFDVTISFIGYMFGLYTDIPMNYIMIAPYIGSKDGQLVPSSYWEQQASRFVSKTANSDGKWDGSTDRIPTFLEFARKFAELDIHSDDILGTDTEEYNRIQTAYTNLNNILSRYEELVKSFGLDKKIYVNSGKTEQYNIFLLQNDIKDYSWNVNNKAKELFDKIKEFKLLFDGADFINGQTICLDYPFLTKTFLNGDKCTINTADLTKYDASTMSFSGTTFFKDGDTDVKFDVARNSKNFDKTVYALGDDKTLYTVLAFPGEQWITKTRNLLKALNTAKNEKMKEAAKSATKVFSEKLGYALSIENVFRMIFAHVECFFYHYLSKTVDEIKKDTNRTFLKYGIKMDETDTYVNRLDQNSFLAPFPALYNTDTRELKYPGEDPRTTNFLEVKLVEDIYNASRMCGEIAKEVSDIMKERLNEMASGEAVSTSSSEAVYFHLPISFDGSFVPLTITDAFCDCTNPYSRIPRTKENNTTYDFVGEVIYALYLRYCAYMMSVMEEDDIRLPSYKLNLNAQELYDSGVKVAGDFRGYSNDYFVACETENIKRAFSKLSKEELKSINYIKDLSSIFNPNSGSSTLTEKRIGQGFNFSNTGNTVLCTGYDTSTYFIPSDMENVEKYTKDQLRGVYVLPESTYDVFASMNSESVEGYVHGFELVNDLVDIRNLSYRDFSGYLSNVYKITNNYQVSLNSVYYLNEGGEREKYLKNPGGPNETITIDVPYSELINRSTKGDVVNHSSAESYFDFITAKRVNTEDYYGLYSPIVLYKDKDKKFQNLFLSDFFWNQKDDTARAFLLLSSLICRNDNQMLYSEILNRVGIRGYRFRKLSALYYGGLIHRLRTQIDSCILSGSSNEKKYIGTDLVEMENGENGDKFGINKDVFNEYSCYSVERSGYICSKDYYYPDYNITESRRRYTKDAPILTLLSGKNSDLYKTMVKKREKLKNGAIYDLVINPLSDTKGPEIYPIKENLKKLLAGMLSACGTDKYDKNNTLSLESYFLNWVNTDFKKFIDILKKDYLDKDHKPKMEKWFNFEYTQGQETTTLPCFQYSEDENSPNMFLNRLQCEQVTILVCVPKEESAKKEYNTEEGFKTSVDTTLKRVLDNLYTYYSDLLSAETEEQTVSEVSEKKETNDSELNKAIYYTLKNLFDKWICGYNDFHRFELPTPNEEHEARVRRYENGTVSGSDDKEYNNFLFVDSFYNDIGNKFYCNPQLLYNLIMECMTGSYKCSIYQFMNRLVQENKLLMKALPVYNNFYNKDTIKEIFTPHHSYDVTDKSNAYMGYGSTYVIMYTHEPSKFLNEESKKEIIYRDDGFDIADSVGHTEKLDSLFELNNNVVKIPVPAFGVTYGMQNQQYFKGMNINMDNPMTTDYAIANTLQLSQTGAKGDKNFPMGIGQNIYSIYSNRSYTITVEMMGCANIMPMMYFQLNNVPMFKGAYMIVSVSHSIKAGTMTTTFTGIRQSKITYPFVNSNIILTDILDRINKGEFLTSGRGGVSDYTTVKGKPFDNEVYFDNALNADKYKWVRTSKGVYPYGRRNGQPKHIILHYTAGRSSAPGTAGHLVKNWVTNWAKEIGGSSDFGVDDGGIYQFTPDINAWQATYCNGGKYDADGNGGRSKHTSEYLNGIGVEICSTLKNGTDVETPNHDGWSFTDDVLKNAVKLCAKLIIYFGWKCDTIEDVNYIISTHYEVSGKKCPGIKGWNNAQWYNENGSEAPNIKNNSDKLQKFREWVLAAVKVYKKSS